MIGLMKTMAKELGPEGIRVNCICPGFIRTQISPNTTEERWNQIKDKIPLGRLGEKEDVANMVLFLASDLASFCHGSCYDVHGGHTL